MIETLTPYALDAKEGLAFAYGGALHLIKATTAQTGGAFGLVEILCPPGFVAPMHRHRLEDESFYVLSGELTIYLEDRRLTVSAGGFAFLPRGSAHGFRVGNQAPLRAISVFTPGGFDSFFEYVGEPTSSLELPLEVKRDFARIASAGSRYDFDDLGPLPD